MSEAEKTTAATAKTVRKIAAKSEATDVFGLSNVEMPEIFRDAAEKSAKQAKDAYEKMRNVAEEATDILEDQFETSRTGFVALNSKALDSAKATSDATFKFAKDVLAVKTFAEMIELQTAFARQQYELFAGQSKEMTELFQKVSTDASAPVKDVFAKMMKDVKAA
ncbi:MAG TPA: TIGR01841 family phasin [Methylomirabilota bacterium]|nr:TIGR01841 family phasin [Methylomirabilota bacterium]